MRPSAPPTPSTSSTAPQGPVPHIGRSLSEPRSLTVMRDDDGLFAAHQYRGGPTVVARGRARSVPGMSALLPGTGTQERVDEPGRGKGFWRGSYWEERESRHCHGGVDHSGNSRWERRGTVEKRRRAGGEEASRLARALRTWTNPARARTWGSEGCERA